jgi:predicted CXXCH cytochrome family protein
MLADFSKTVEFPDARGAVAIRAGGGDHPFFDFPQTGGRGWKRFRVDFGARAFYRDGRFRETTFIGEAFLRSACFRRGTAQCVSCHNPHPPDAAGNPTSLKFRDDPDQMCVPCHTAVGAQGVVHTHHPANSPGASLRGVSHVRDHE